MTSHLPETSETSTSGASGRPLVALIAGEASGDALGAELAAALRQRLPGVRLVGIAGPRMRAAGVEGWHDVEELSVMGLTEVLAHLPRLLRIRRHLAARLLEERPDLVMGIDAPDFNLGLERRLKRAGIHTAHYVSPSIWAWREQRARRIGASAERVLCLFPMEPRLYARHGVDARFVGHPLADQFPLTNDRAAARKVFRIPDDVPVLAVLPGSRLSEIERLGEIFLAAAARVLEALPDLHILAPMAAPRCHQAFRRQLAAQTNRALRERVRLIDGQAAQVMIAADVVLLASGTAALEAMLAKRPMVAGYRLSAASYWFLRGSRLLKTRYYTLPNILAGEPLVPELMQENCRPQALADALLDLFGDTEKRTGIVSEFEQLHARLKAPGQASAAEAAAAQVVDMVDRKPEPAA